MLESAGRFEWDAKIRNSEYADKAPPFKLIDLKRMKPLWERAMSVDRALLENQRLLILRFNNGCLGDLCEDFTFFRVNRNHPSGIYRVYKPP